MRYALPLVLVALLATVTGCKSGEDAATTKSDVAMGSMNSNCPIMGEDFDSSNPPASVEYDGVTIGFCCPGCVKAWNEWDDVKQAEYFGSLN